MLESRRRGACAEAEERICRAVVGYAIAYHNPEVRYGVPYNSDNSRGARGSHSGASPTLPHNEGGSKNPAAHSNKTHACRMAPMGSLRN